MRKNLSILFHFIFIVIFVYSPHAQQRGIKFTCKTDGPIRCKPVIDGDILLFGSGDGKMYAIDKRDGHTKWEFKTKGAIFSSPVVNKKIVYFTSKDDCLYAVNIYDGRLSWKFEFGEDLGSQNFWDYYTSSPVVLNNSVYIGSGDGFFYALNESSGKVKWKFNASSRIRREAAFSRNKIIFGTMSGNVFALDTAGTMQWTFATDGTKIHFHDNGLDMTSIFSIPVVKDQYVIIAGRDFNLYALDIDSGKEIWRYAHPNSWVLSAGITGDEVIAGSGSAAFVHASDLRTGSLLWRFKTKSAVYSSFAFAATRVYFGDLNGNLYGLDAKSGEQKWLFPMGRTSFSTPIIEQGTIYCSSDDGILYAVHVPGESDSSYSHSKKIVYWEGNLSDSAYHDFNNNVDLWIRDYLKRQDYELMSAKKLEEFMSITLGDASRTVIVFADNKLPRALLRETNGKALIRRYLDAGGKLVLLTTVNPLFVQRDSVSGVMRGTDTQLASAIFGIQFPSQDVGNGLYYAPYTDEGKRLGLRGYCIGFWPVQPQEVTTVLARDEFGKATAWLKNYGGREGSGLLQLSVNPPGALGADFYPMRMAIEYGITW